MAEKEPLTREQKAVLIFNGVAGKVEGDIENDFTVINGKGGKHTVRLHDEFTGECDCMDFIIRGRGMQGYSCKHVLAAFLLHEKQISEV